MKPQKMILPHRTPVILNEFRSVRSKRVCATLVLPVNDVTSEEAKNHVGIGVNGIKIQVHRTRISIAKPFFQLREDGACKLLSVNDLDLLRPETLLTWKIEYPIAPKGDEHDEKQHKVGIRVPGQARATDRGSSIFGPVHFRSINIRIQTSFAFFGHDGTSKSVEPTKRVRFEMEFDPRWVGEREELTYQSRV